MGCKRYWISFCCLTKLAATHLSSHSAAWQVGLGSALWWSCLCCVYVCVCLVSWWLWVSLIWWLDDCWLTKASGEFGLSLIIQQVNLDFSAWWVVEFSRPACMLKSSSAISLNYFRCVILFVKTSDKASWNSKSSKKLHLFVWGVLKL